MQVPQDERRNGRPLRSCLLLAVLAALLTCAAVAGDKTGKQKPDKQKPDKQGTLWLQLHLDDLGFPGISAPFLESGASMFTVHFLDDTHLLLTYSQRSLIRRLPDDPDGGQDDRLVAAKVLELPSARVVAQTEWHMHDHARYLWALGGGSFLLRIGDRLSTISPLAHLQANEHSTTAEHKDVFQRTAFPGRSLLPSVVMVSPDGGLVTVETVVRTATSTGQTVVVLGDTDNPVAEQQGTKTLIDFYRIDRTAGPVTAIHAGTISAGLPLLLPVDADGLLWAHQDGSDGWSLTFDPFGGKSRPIGVMQSTCQPRLQMLDRSEFLALTCRGGEDRLKIASYGLDGKETWEEQVGDFGVPTFTFAPEAARFAVSHINPAQVPVTAGQRGIPATQEVRIYQNASGDLLLHVETTPIMKSAENFDLSSDGTLAVVVRNNALAIYKLPPVSSRDREDIAEVEKFAPPALTSGPVTLPRITTPVARSTSALATPSPASQAPAASPQPQPAVSAQTQQPRPRKPPTFLEPGEKPEFGKPNEPPPH